MFYSTVWLGEMLIFYQFVESSRQAYD